MIPVISILFAICLPVFALRNHENKHSLKYPYIFSVASFTFCASGIIAELFTIKQRLFAGDIGGIEDTIDAALIICIILLVVTAILNLMLLAATYNSEK
jgi:hypothetical protein